ncbi:hypothetical protein VKT23_019337 [Stygiomarasmius scandens]|uniref:Uncharacterized protein n=1 Tax=Marasmiellus scandens TaxID=2682957 RepID=A0ABR1IPL3_9AGAR
MAKMTYREEILSDLGAVYYRMSYLDLWVYLYKLCTSCGIQCKFNLEVAEINISTLDSGGVTITSTTGECINGDIVIGADGHNSIVCKTILSNQPVVDYEEEAGQIEWAAWMGYGQLHNAGKEGNEQYGLNIYYPFKQYDITDMDWDIQRPGLSADELQMTQCRSQ